MACYFLFITSVLSEYCDLKTLNDVHCIHALVKILWLLTLKRQQSIWWTVKAWITKKDQALLQTNTSITIRKPYEEWHPFKNSVMVCFRCQLTTVYVLDNLHDMFPHNFYLVPMTSQYQPLNEMCSTACQRLKKNLFEKNTKMDSILDFRFCHTVFYRTYRFSWIIYDRNSASV